ncbi:hypothetical protein BJX99DRAFT_259830 [Aspergillus californicus]
MSGPFQKSSFNSSNPSTLNSPLSPPPRDNTPVSFKPNVNRAKTKRWVDAKKYSYDGDDWGEDEYGEYEYDDEPPVPQDPRISANQSTPDVSNSLPKSTSHPPLPSMDRSHSMDQVRTIPTKIPAVNSPASPIVHPADIYRRMREEQKGHQASPPTPSSGERTLGNSVTSPSTSNAPPENYESSALVPAQNAIDFSYDGNGAGFDYSKAPPTTANEPPAISLPDVKRFSAFSPDIFPNPGTDSQDQDPMNQPHQLQHNPSLGFRSAVNQAFDVPETPSTIADSVARSNSDSTTGISPIMHRTTTDLRTPTIEEDPNESIDTPAEFKPGHRRDLSLPSSGSSPSRKPIITEPNASASSELAHISAGTPSESPLDKQHLSEPLGPLQSKQEMSGRDLPAPLNVQTNVAPGPPMKTDVPVIIPSMSSDNSPEDTENDRLRKEIIRSLSRENSPSEQQDRETLPQTSRQNSLFPTEYDSHWNGQNMAGPEQAPPTTTLIPAQTATEAPWTESVAPPQDAQRRKKLQRRFSWEESDDDEDPTSVAQAQPSRPPPMPGQFPFSQDSVHPDSVIVPPNQPAETVDHIGGRDELAFAPSPAPALEKPKLTVIPPSAIEDDSFFPSESTHESPHSRTIDTLAQAEEGQSYSPDQQSYEHPAQTSTSMESGLLGFKDILGIQSSNGRVEAFNRTRDQFAAIDTGLNHWIQFTVQAHPEHFDVVKRNTQPLSDEFKNNVPRTKFPKLSSLGNLASSLQDNSHSSSGHIRRPSAPLGSVKQGQVGKDLLHTAGVLGGQAGKAAKGFFSKGRNLEDPLDLHESRSSRPWTANRKEDPLTTRGGEELFVQHSTPKAARQCDLKQSGRQQRSAGSSHSIPCPIEQFEGERQGEPHQDYYSRPPSRNEDAECQLVEHSSANTRNNSGHEENEDVSSLDLQEEADLILDCRPSLAQKLDESQPRHLGGRIRSSAGDWTSQGNNILPCREAIQSQSDRRPSTTAAGLLPPLSPQHDWARRPDQLSSSQDPASNRISSSPSPMEKLKNVGRFRRISMGTNQPHHKTGQSPKRPFHRLAGLFSRSHLKKSGPPAPVDFSTSTEARQHLAPSPRPDSRFTSSSISSFDHHDRPISLPDGRITLQRSRAPVDGYFTHESPDSFSVAQPHRHSRATASSDRIRLSDPTPTTRDFRRLSPHHSPSYKSLATQQRQAPTSSPRVNSTASPPAPPPAPAPAPVTPPSRGRSRDDSEDRTYAQELQLRSRSPKAFAPRPEERNLPKHDPTDPAFTLGAFRSSNFRTSRSGDQQLPWKITIPGDSDEIAADPSASWRQETEGVLNGTGSRLPTYQEDAEENDHVHPQLTHSPPDEKRHFPNHALLPAAPIHTTLSQLPPPPPPQPPPPPPNLTTSDHPHRSGARTINTIDAPVELPVRTDDDSSEEIVMSSTAYPGQEWRPLGFSEWEHP